MTDIRNTISTIYHYLSIYICIHTPHIYVNTDIYIYIYTSTKFVYITIYITIKKVNIWEYLRPLTLPIQSNFFYSKNFVLTVALIWCEILRLYVLSYWTSTLEKLFFWSNLYKTEVIITSLIEMLVLPNFSHRS